MSLTATKLARTAIIVVVIAPLLTAGVQFGVVSPNATALVDETVKLTCQATNGSGSPTIQWWKGPQLITELGLRFRLVPSSEAQVSVRNLTISNVVVNDSGLYSCRITDANVTIIREILLTVSAVTTSPSPSPVMATTAAPPVATAAPTMPLMVTVSDQTVMLNINKSTSVSCSVVGNEAGAIDYNWFKVGMNSALQSGIDVSNCSAPVGIGHPSSILISKYGQSSNLTFCNSQRAMAGNYKCKAQSGQNSGEAHVQFQAPPTIVPDFKKDKATTLLTGESASFLCMVRGYPMPNITWKKDGDEISFQSKCRHSLQQTNKSVADYQPSCRGNDNECIFETCRISLVYQMKNLSSNDGVRVEKIIIDNLQGEDSAEYSCYGIVGNVSSHNETTLRVHSRLRPLWPAIGIVIEILVLILAIMIGEKVEKRRKGKKLQRLRLEREKSMRESGSRSPSNRLQESSFLLPDKHGVAPRKRTLTPLSLNESESVA